MLNKINIFNSQLLKYRRNEGCSVIMSKYVYAYFDHNFNFLLKINVYM